MHTKDWDFIVRMMEEGIDRKAIADYLDSHRCYFCYRHKNVCHSCPLLRKLICNEWIFDVTGWARGHPNVTREKALQSARYIRNTIRRLKRVSI
jgi:hypothetical protein